MTAYRLQFPDGGRDLPQFFLHFAHDTPDIRPVKTGLGGLLLKLIGPIQRRQGTGYFVQERILGFTALLLYLDLCPILQDLSAVLNLGLRVPWFPEYMGVAADKLFRNAFKGVGHGEKTLLLVHIGKHGYQEEEIPQFFLNMGRILFVDGLYTFVGFFYQITPEGSGTLFPVPGTAIGRTELDYGFIKGFKGFGLGKVLIRHTPVLPIITGKIKGCKETRKKTTTKAQMANKERKISISLLFFASCALVVKNSSCFLDVIYFFLIPFRQQGFRSL
jgi:hypothetical protein